MISLWYDLELALAVRQCLEKTDRCTVDIARDERYPDMALHGDSLQLFDEPVAFLLHFGVRLEAPKKDN
jgi:hypothetical protein